MSNNLKSDSFVVKIDVPPAIRFVCCVHLFIGFFLILQSCFSFLSKYFFLFILSVVLLSTDQSLSQTIDRSMGHSTQFLSSVFRGSDVSVSGKNVKGQHIKKSKTVKYPAFCVFDSVVSNTPVGIFQLVQKKNDKTGVNCDDFTDEQFSTLSLSFTKIITDPVRGDTQINDLNGVWVFTGLFPIIFDSSLSTIADKTGTYFSDVKANAVCFQGKVVVKVGGENLILSRSTHDGFKPITCDKIDNTVLPQYQYDGHHGITNMVGCTLTKSGKNLWVSQAL